MEEFNLISSALSKEKPDAGVETSAGEEPAPAAALKSASSGFCCAVGVQYMSAQLIET